MELSKRKYIYKIYSSEDKTVHCEKFSIVYNNSYYTYFKSVRKGGLDCLGTKEIKETFSGVVDLKVSTYGRVLPHYFYRIENFNSKEVTDIVFEKYILDKLERKRQDVERIKRQLDYEFERLKKMENDLIKE